MADADLKLPNEARSELDRIPLDGELMTALQDPSHPGHKAASIHRRSLYAAANGEGNVKDGDARHSEKEKQDLPPVDGEREFFSPPSDPKDYRFDPSPHGLPYDHEMEQKARGWFHQAGIPQWLARNVVREWNRTVEKQPDPRQLIGAAAATERSLRRTWGKKYEPRIDAARTLVRSLKSDEVMYLLDRSGLANNEYLIRQLVALAESRSGSR
jgi:hypothetical protein